MDHNKYMTTGEFARRMGVTKNTLFHYDNIGLFLPEIVDTNDYRYYSIYQMEVFDTIIIYEEIRDETDAGILKKTNEFITEFERRNYQMDYEIGYIQNENDILSGVYDNYTNAVILPFKKPKGMDYQIIKAGEYLTVYHKGHWNTIGAAYERLLENARCRQIKIDHIFLETYAVNNLMAESIEDYVTEIGVRIIS